MGLFDPTTKALLASVLTDASTNFNINYISVGKYQYDFNYSTALQKLGSFQIPSVKNVTFTAFRTAFECSVQIRNLDLDNDGSVYFIIQRRAKIVFDTVYQVWRNVEVEPTGEPTANQILNCQYFLGTSAQCLRAIYSNNKTLQADFKNLQFETEYVIYYTVANEYPINPVVGTQVFTYVIQIGASLNNANPAPLLRAPVALLLAALALLLC